MQAFLIFVSENLYILILQLHILSVLYCYSAYILYLMTYQSRFSLQWCKLCDVDSLQGQCYTVSVGYSVSKNAIFNIVGKQVVLQLYIDHLVKLVRYFAGNLELSLDTDVVKSVEYLVTFFQTIQTYKHLTGIRKQIMKALIVILL